MACRKLSHFNSWIFILDFTWNCCRLLEARKFSRKPDQFISVLLEKLDITIHRGTLNTESLEPNYRISLKT